MTTEVPPRPRVRPRTDAPHPDGRVRARWTRVLGLGAAAFAVWFLLFAPTLQHNAQVSPVGTRRTVSLDLVGPVAALSRALGLSHIVSATGREHSLPGGTSGLVTRGPSDAPGRTRSVLPASHSHTGVTTTTLPDGQHPTTADPLRVLIIGDSLGLDMGGALQYDLAATGVVSASLDARESTGLTRPDYFDWPAELQSDLKKVDPQVVVVMMGANDAQDFLGPPDVPYSSPQWNTMYSQRASQFMKIAQSGGAAVIWIGMPPMQNPGLSAQMNDIDAVDQGAAARQTPLVHYLSTWTVLGTPQGGYTAFITNGAGQVVNIRTPDGTHLTPGGSQVAAQLAMNELSQLGYHL
jgi:uncharacterized protein